MRDQQSGVPLWQARGLSAAARNTRCFGQALLSRTRGLSTLDLGWGDPEAGSGDHPPTYEGPGGHGEDWGQGSGSF